MKHGIVLVPEDRTLQGILANLSVSDNINISMRDAHSNRLGFVNRRLGVILISSELPEVIGLSDRVIVMKSRKIVGEVAREDATESRLLSLGMMGEVKEA